MDLRTTDESATERGVRPIPDLVLAEAIGIGEEAADLVRLRQASVPMAHGWLVSLKGAEVEARLVRAVQHALHDGEPGQVVRLRPLFPTRALGQRFERQSFVALDIPQGGDVTEPLVEWLQKIDSPEVTAALGGALTRMHVRVVVKDAGPSGWAASADPVLGDPDRIRVWEKAVAPWLVDRRTARVTTAGEGQLDSINASSVADLADRAQLALGYPVEIEWCRSQDRFAIVSVRPVALHHRFTPQAFRIVSLVAADEGVVAPLAVDSLDKALRPTALTDDAMVQRIYARPYRRITNSRRIKRTGGPASLARAAAETARVAADLAAPLAAARSFERSLGKRLVTLDAISLVGLDDDALMEAVRERQGLVVEALSLLERTRKASRAALSALEAALGSLPRDSYSALAAPRPIRARRRLNESVDRFARQIEAEVGHLEMPERLPAELRRRWYELRREASDTRVLGIDIGPLPIGYDDEQLFMALRRRQQDRDESVRRARKDAQRRLLAAARDKPFGQPREALVRSLLMLLSRLARAKGSVADGHSLASLRLRRAACEVGRRLVDQGLLETPDDALYMFVAEMGQGLLGEPGAYAARVRLRREDDQRWAGFEAPRRIEARNT